MLFKVKTYKESRLVNKIATEIGYGFLKFYQRDLAQTYAILDQLQITDLKVKKTRKKITIQITLYRPGIFIGAGGLVIQFITDFIKENNNGIDVEIKEDIGPGLTGIEIKSGYMEVVDLKKIFKEMNLREKNS